MKQIFSIKTLQLILIAAFLTACGGSSGGGGGTVAAEENTWGTMVWDEGKWD